KRFLLCGLSLLSLMLAVAVVGCDLEPVDQPAARAAAPAPKAEKKAEVKKVVITPNIVLEIEGQKRRVLVGASICLQKGPLEQLLTRKDTKEHEAVLSADIDARELHKALLLAGARAGAPVKFGPPYKAASGQTIKITCEYEAKGKVVSVRAQEWVRDANTKKILNHDWVFAGSRLVPNPLDPNKLIYLANDGDVVCVSNFESALLDLPIKSSKANSELVFEANTERIPPVGTKVTVIFEPVPEKK
ncbi:MAG: hypothetical protein HYS12_29830, partial [Planctomycetes bacterium]|nr:hypothetical protein [Planctomycetota bacterium]